MNKIIDNIKSGNYEVADNQGVSVTGHFTQCLEKEFAYLEAKLAEKDAERELDNSFWKQECDSLQKALDEKEKEIEKLNACVDFYKSYYISFKEKVIDELEKVKEFFLEEHRDEEMDTDYLITKDAGEIADYLLDQIKQLKEMK